MTIIARSTRENTIFLPERLFTLLKLREGDAIKAVVEGQTLRVARMEAFLSLRGILAGDEAFDQALEELGQGWNEWAMPESV